MKVRNAMNLTMLYINQMVPRTGRVKIDMNLCTTTQIYVHILEGVSLNQDLNSIILGQILVRFPLINEVVVMVFKALEVTIRTSPSLQQTLLTLKTLIIRPVIVQRP
uniref:Clone ZZD618 mRNA sequence n=1 Tax=Schistosoma japonicum TaxID=6182 RepID=Q86EA7_SCHJA|nr:hypothetical protein [Schistosoma japonicum]